MLRRVAVYLGSRVGASAHYADAAADFGSACARRGLGIVYGGGGIGLMGVLADAALSAGGQVHGVIPRSMIAQERAHRALTELIAVETMHERKARMAQMADAFVVLPGGVGTLDEFFEVYTWLQLGLHGKPIAVLNTHGFYDCMLRMLEHMTEQGFLPSAQHRLIIVEHASETLLDRLQAG